MGRDRDVRTRDDWEEVKIAIMTAAVLKKFQTHAVPRDLLLSGGEDDIIENAPGDYFWGGGQDGSGLNHLGRILMNVRRHLR
ncbi:hypothetical protein ABAC402_02320 [Asticcacaulis sp. AC402]|nr:hypothetical protein ABAC402_02320 [Asticcacaulis sp. AC402]